MSRAADRAALGCAVVATAIVVVVLVGWAVRSETLTSVVPGYTSMKVNTALSGLLLAGAVLVRRRCLAVASAAVVLALVSATLVEYVAGIDLRIDQLLVVDPWPGLNPAGRMAPATAVSFGLLAVARILIATRGPRAGAWLQGLCTAAFTAAFLAIVGYQFGAKPFYALSSVGSIALHTAVVIMLLAVATLAVLPSGPVVEMIEGRTPGAILLRRMVPVALVVLPALAFVVDRLSATTLFGERFGVALIVSCGAALVVGAAVVAGRRVNAFAAAEDEARRELQGLNRELAAARDVERARAEMLDEDLVLERAEFSRILETIDETLWSLRVSETGLETVYAGRPSATLFGGPLPDGLNALAALLQMVHPDDRIMLDRFRAEVEAGGPADVEVRIVGLDGGVRWAWLRGTPRRAGAQTVFDGITTDVTERRAAAEDREALLRLEQARVEELRELAGCVRTSWPSPGTSCAARWRRSWATPNCSATTSPRSRTRPG